MHDIWNPWHGCLKYSEGCDHCYMYFLDRMRDRNAADIYQTKTGFDYPLQKRRDGSFRVQSGELLRVCMSSDFFLKEADAWRDGAWEIIRRRPDVKFFLLTKRAERIADCLPPDWGNGWENVMLNVTAENQRRADDRLPILLDIPARHKGVMCAPLLSAIDLREYLADGQIEQVICGGENYDGARPCHFDWIKAMRAACVEQNITFCFIETGTVFVKDGKRYHIPNKQVQSRMAFRSGMNFTGKPISWRLTDESGRVIPQEKLYVPHYREHCRECASRLICNGCSDCGKCGKP